jgi:putative endopeptidase
MQTLPRRALAACLLAALAAAPAMVTAQLAPAAAAARGMNPAVQPGDDFYQYANGAWLAATEIPADRSSWGAGAILADETNKRIIALIEQAASARPAARSAAWPTSTRPI